MAGHLARTKEANRRKNPGLFAMHPLAGFNDKPESNLGGMNLALSCLRVRYVSKVINVGSKMYRLRTELVLNLPGLARTDAKNSRSTDD